MWCSAWLHGAAASDDVLDALHSWGEENEFVAGDDSTAAALELPRPGTGAAAPAEFLTVLRRLGAATARLTLPVPGDVRGLGGHTELTKAALRAGEAAVFPDIGSGGLAVVHEHIAEGLARWTTFEIDAPPMPEHTGVGEAEHLLTDAVRDSARTLQEMDVARERPGVRDELTGRLRGRPQLDWPSDMPQRALRVLQRADEVGAIVELALADEPGGAHSASAATRRAEALRPLSNAVRTARRAAVDESVRVLTRQRQNKT